MKKLKSSSLFRIIVFSIFSIYIDNIFVYALTLIFITLISFKETLFYILLLSLLLIINNFRCDFIYIGIIESKNDNKYIVDKLLYKVKVQSDNELEIGDVLYFDTKFDADYNSNDLKKNILYYGYSYKKIFNFKLRKLINNHINSYSDNCKDILNKFFYNINNYDNTLITLSYGINSYLLIRRLIKKNIKISIIFVLIYLILFINPIKFILIISEIILRYFNLNKVDKLAIKLLIIYLINPYLLNNYAILVPLIIDIYAILEFQISFKMFLTIMSTTLFGEINLIYLLFYNIYSLFYLLIQLSCIILLIIPYFESIFNLIIKVYEFISNINISIRGSISILGIIIFLLIHKIFNIKNNLYRYILFLLVLLSPINNPFMHISFIDVGQGDAILIKYPFNTYNVLIDTGSEYNYYSLKTYLLKQGIYKIDYLIITHNDSDHNGNVASLLNDFKIEEIITSGKDISINKSKLQYLDLGTYDNDNDNSLIYLLNVNNLNFLFTGDISSNVEKVLIQKYPSLDIDVLKVSHHGSKTASSKLFLGEILPEYAIISTSGQYGHPAEEVIENLNAYLVRIFNTKEDGDIEIYFTLLYNIIKYRICDFVIIK